MNKNRPSEEGIRLVVEPQLLTTWSKREMNLVFEQQGSRTPESSYKYVLRSAKVPARKALLSQIQTARSVERELLPTIADKLSELHQEALPERSWNILVGHWLRALCENVVRRESELSTIDLGTRRFSLAGHQITSDLVPATTADGTSVMSDPRWGQFVYANIVEKMALGTVATGTPGKSQDANRNGVSGCDIRIVPTVNADTTLSFTDSYFNLVSRLFNGAGVLSSTYLSRKTQLRLLASVHPRTVLIRSLPPKIPKRHPEFGLRESVSAMAFEAAHSSRGKLVLHLFWLLCPMSFLENFRDHVESLRTSVLPANPRFILTGNSFDGSNDLWRFYLAFVTARGTKYIVNQHGNLYGTSIFRSPSIEEQTSDIFITWGWATEENFARYEALGRTRVLSRRRNSASSGALFVLDVPISPAGILDPHVWNKAIFDRQTETLGLLTDNFIRASTLRFHPSQPQRWPSQRLQWAARFPHLAQDFGEFPISKLIRRHQLTVFLYDSTGVLEALQSNHPTLCFLPEGLDHIASESLKDFENMVTEGIFLTDVNDLKRFFDEHAHDIDEWWSHKQRRTVVAEFAAKYSRVNKSFGRDFRRMILDS